MGKEICSLQLCVHWHMLRLLKIFVHCAVESVFLDPGTVGTQTWENLWEGLGLERSGCGFQVYWMQSQKSEISMCCCQLALHRDSSPCRVHRICTLLLMGKKIKTKCFDQNSWQCLFPLLPVRKGVSCLWDSCWKSTSMSVEKRWRVPSGDGK